jgi:hypothetical protein
MIYLQLDIGRDTFINSPFFDRPHNLLWSCSKDIDTGKSIKPSFYAVISDDENAKE